MSEEFMEALRKILEEENLPPGTVNKVAIAIALDAKNSIVEHKLETAKMMAEMRSSIQAQTDNIERVANLIERQQRHIEMHPSLIYLLRFKTRETIGIIIFLFALLSLWWVSSFRQAILNFFGLPSF